MRKLRILGVFILLVVMIAAVVHQTALAATLIVTRADDPTPDGCNSGVDCSLREAMLAANLNAGPDTITFNIAGCGGVCTITPASNLPFLLDGSTTINGYTQPGTSVATETTPANLLIEINGINVTNNNGFNVVSSHNEIAGLIINNFGLYGVAIYGTDATDNHIHGNVIGTNGADANGMGNGGGVGLGDAATNNVIGGDAYAERNVISGNDVNGIDVIAVPGAPAFANTISGNYVGTSADGESALANGHTGIQLGYGTYGNTVGGLTAQERNVISGNTIDGMLIWKPMTNANLVIGNYIGTDKDATTAIPNGQNGINVMGGTYANTLGGDTAAERNVISGNGVSGVRLYGVDTSLNIIIGNYIGTDAAGAAAVGNGDNGVLITEGPYSNTIGGDTPGEANVISGNGIYGVHITDGSALPEYPNNNTVIGNRIGTNPGGTAALPNGQVGVAINGGAQDNHIGGLGAAERNLISGNPEVGVSISGSGTTGNVVTGNYIGLAANGTAAIPNGNGINIWGGAQNNTIGGDSADERNVIAGNGGYGLHIDDADTDLNAVSGNYIGVDATGSAAFGNGYAGIRISAGAQSNTIGGTSAGEGNVIAASGWDGIEINGEDSDGNKIFGNYIGTDSTGLLARANTYYGIQIDDGADNTLIGGTTAEARNVICANGSGGIHINNNLTNGTVISGNYIGVGSDGSTALPNLPSGVWLESGPSWTTIGGSSPGAGNVISAHSGSQIALTGSGTDNIVISGNIIGLAADGLTDLPGANAGIYLDSGVNNVTIGGVTSAERNLISGNSTGIVVAGSGTFGVRIIGNYIGTDSSGTVAVGNSFDGISIESGASDNEIGGDLTGEGNLISGNDQNGIKIMGAATTGNVIQGNKIGADVTGMSALPNGRDGIFLINGTMNNTIGGLSSGSRNIISGNTLDGIEIQASGADGTTIYGNWIGLNAGGGNLGNGEYGVLVGWAIGDATIGPANRIAFNGLDGVYAYGLDTENVVITQNSIFQNANDGIMITSDANNNILPPTITATSMSSVLIEGTACSGCTVEVFTNLAGEDQGRTFIGSTAADLSGNWSLTVDCIGSPYLTATATDSVDGTSEFSSVFTSSVRCLFMPLIMR